MFIKKPSLKPGEKHIMIVGGGFAGLNAAKRLADRPGVQITLIDQRNYHLFQPLLYQVATAGLNPADIAVPIRAQFSKARNISVHMGTVHSIDLKNKFVRVGEPPIELGFDYLILATGALHSYFGKYQWEDFAPGLKTIEQALEIRRRILSAFEYAENETNPAVQAALLTFVIVGGGPTGVELAGSIADISRTVLVKDFTHINPASARIVLIEAGDRVLASFPQALSEHALRDLNKLGVEVKTSSRVNEIDAEGVRIGDLKIAARNVFWAAGVQATKLSKTLGVELDRAGRVKVRSDFSIPGFPDTFAVGDLAHFEMDDGKPLPGLAPAAIQAGRHAAENILASIAGKPRKPFRYVDKGQMATIGKRKAIAVLGKLKLTGYLAWLSWLFIHILYLIGFKNRLVVFFEWSWSYIFSKRGSRLITSKDWKLGA
ncbi:MAG: NAD(P)/FAD-dependent oxidoreductase [Oligoflexia bacterium]|nr:NAD(P)/FAD-dependent oxidoreductase [Oligoflexia bacterium]